VPNDEAGPFVRERDPLWLPPASVGIAHTARFCILVMYIGERAWASPVRWPDQTGYHLTCIEVLESILRKQGGYTG
jgi:hypothetical protein